MAELKKIADATAKDLLKAIRSQTSKADDTELLNLAQAYSLVVSAEVTFEWLDEEPLLAQTTIQPRLEA